LGEKVATKEKSDPLIRDEILCKLECGKQFVGSSLQEIRDHLGMQHVSMSKFDAAIGSLSQYKRRLIVWRKFWPDEPTQSKSHSVQLS
jgi:hypothetical protein